MGVEHRKAVEAIPVELMHRDERQVLYALATQTNDRRLEWAHDRAKLLGVLGLRDNRNGREWLRRRLQALDDAGWITRRSQPRLKDGTWGWPLIRLTFRELGDSMALGHALDGWTPTPRAQDGRGDNSGTFRHRPDARNTARDETGKFAPDSEPAPLPTTDGVHQVPGTAVPPDTTDPSHQVPGTSPDFPDIEPRHSRTFAPTGAGGRLPPEPDLSDTFEDLDTEIGQANEDDDLEERKRRSIAALDRTTHKNAHARDS